uniref:response regulator n=1 Tax=Odoribacter sp. N15.MGS-14 TaxID=1637502 RepID=UPI000A5CBD0F
TLKPSEKPTILVAEDTESNFYLISTLLKKDYTILRARTGLEAVNLYRLNHPELILMDMRMPEMNGWEATRIIREQDPQIPIVALTAFAFDSDKSKTLEAGCNACLSKPIASLLLKQTIRELLE